MQNLYQMMSTPGCAAFSVVRNVLASANSWRSNTAIGTLYNLNKDRSIEYAQVRYKSLKRFLDFSKVPKLLEEDLEEQYVRGSGPGGSNVNKTNNAVVLKHKPTGIIVKSHETRSQWDNRKIAREKMIMKLDNLINGENSIENQERALQTKFIKEKQAQKKKLRDMKAAFKEREGLT
ncbi:probable peptide chain release factor C12orf65 homolog, mitochondrial [Orussus abietinus]|uniref:probable peptide chain release factor C12orf65 homolog, mitochondrial n=1 Tax=Orussus abietinus TaxID=222816 RepID=UPI0006267490|nr:probable peptide chain release factor C12orf65 homolog, mitochondrial [Orussus abietinus]